MVTVLCAAAVTARLSRDQPSAVVETPEWRATVGDGYSVAGVQLSMPKNEVERVLGLPVSGDGNFWSYLPVHFGFIPCERTVTFENGVVQRVRGDSLEREGLAIAKLGESPRVLVRALGTPDIAREKVGWRYEKWCFPRQTYTIEVYVRNDECCGFLLEWNGRRPPSGESLHEPGER